MASIAIVGKSGSGKSTSYGQIPEIGVKGLNPKETAIINVSGKDLPFKGWQAKYNKENKNYAESSDADKIKAYIEHYDKQLEIKNIVIDDAQYIMAFEFMGRARETGYGKFADLGVNLAKVLTAAKNTRRDLKIYFLWHPEEDKDTGFKMKTVGKMVDDYLTLEGLFTVVLYSSVSKGADNKINYSFVTNYDGKFPAKSPVGMFKDIYIPNDLGFVSESIDKYNQG